MVNLITHALVREPAPSVVHGLRAVDVGAPDFRALRAEHAAYVAALEGQGVQVDILPPLEEFPDSVFVEDPALVFGDGAILLRPGAPTRLGEADAIAPALEERFPRVMRLRGPGHADGGDVLVTPDAVMIGLSSRTDAAGARELVSALARLGRRATVVEPPTGVLHFKTDCSLLDEESVLVTARLAATGIFERMRLLVVPEGEEAAANALRVNDAVLLGEHFPRTREMLEAAGYRVVGVPVREIGKVDAGLSCMSLRWHRD